MKGFLGLDGELDYEGVGRVVSRWQPFGGLVYFHLLLDSLSQAGLVAAEQPDAATHALPRSRRDLDSPSTTSSQARS